MPELQPSPTIYLPRLILADELDSSLPLEHTAVSGQVTGPAVSVVVSQRFGNPLKEPAELDYLFPLPEDAAVTSFELVIGERRITGELQEHEAARIAYEDARQQGRRSGLLEQRRPNLFAVRIANVQPGENIQATLRYQQRLKFVEAIGEGVYEFVYPMGITPKYDSPDRPGEGEGVHAPVTHPGETVGPVEISLSVDANWPVGEPHSPSHSIDTIRLDESRLQVRLAGEQIPDRDFVLRWPVSTGQARAAAWTSGEPNEAYFLAALVPPLQEGEPEPPPREFVFVLDRSGSMSGEPIRQARNALRACLRSLGLEDTFSILLFDNQLEWFRAEPVPVTQEQVNQADAFLDKVHGRGGTEIVSALEAALSLPVDAHRTRFIVFLTDGAVSAETRVLDSIRQRIGAARLFTFGIGPSVNRALLSRMAGVGRGRVEFLQFDEDIEGAIIRFQDSVSFTALTDLALEWENGKAWDVYPARLPDLYYGQPLDLSGRVARSGDGPVRLKLRGKRAGQPVELSLALPETAGQDRAVERLWARARVDDLFEQMALEPAQSAKLRAEILSLALEYHLVTAFTSFVAVDRDAVDTQGGQPRIIHVSQPLPQGLQMGVVGAPPTPMLRAMAMPLPAAPRAAPGEADQLGGTPMQKMSSGGVSGGSRGSRLLQTISRAVRPVMGQASVPTPQSADREAALRWLARSQKLDGSWNGDGEWTAAALLAFIRAGHTTRAGSYRQALRRAARWLVENPGQGLARFLRARALAELAAATGDPADKPAAQAARLVLPPPSNSLELAALEQPVQPPAEVRTLDDLRLAALLRADTPVSGDLFRGPQADLAQLWLAVMQPGE